MSVRSAGARLVESPRLAEFQRRTRNGGRPRRDRAWSTLVRRGVPVVERVEAAPGTRRLTFVWRDPPAGAHPSVFATVGTIDPEELSMLPVGRTGVWYRSFHVPARARISYAFSPRPNPGFDAPDPESEEYWRGLGPDPENPRHLVFPRDADHPRDPPTTFSIVELPGAPAQPWIARARSPWSEESFRRKSRFVPGERPVWTCLASEAEAARARTNLLVLFDGAIYRSTIPASRIVSNLVDAGRIGPTAIVLIGNASGARTAELGGNPRFVEFLARELWPWLRRRFRFDLPPARVVLAGSSLGGLAAALAAHTYPGLFGNVIAQSGAFLHPCRDRNGRTTTIMRLFARAPRRTLRFYLDVGSLETVVAPGMTASLLGGVRHFRDVLEAKGYPVTYSEFAGGHDYACWRGTLADGLIALLGRGG